MKTIHVPLGKKSYDVHIGKGLLEKVDTFINNKKQYVVITDKNIPESYVNILKDKLNVMFTFVLNPGESLKCFAQVDLIINEMIQNKIPRSITLIALGGGVIGDLTGFVASVYMRGVDYIQIPTSLLAQVDSSVGGKVGINTSDMKNSVGSFYQPQVVIIDPSTLDTLEERHFNNGMAELIKHGVIAGETLFKELLEGNSKENIENLIFQSIQIKTNIVIQDIKDTGIRQILNYGHTIGHAIEQNSNYDLLHGEAISIGMAKMAKGRSFEKDLLAILHKYSLPTEYEYDKEEIFNYIKTDKKVLNGKLNMIIVREVGNALIKSIELDKIKKYL